MSSDVQVSNVAELVAQLAIMFPRHYKELLEWSPVYAARMGHLTGDAMQRAFAQVLTTWTKSTPPKPGDFASVVRMPHGGAPNTLPLWAIDADGQRRLTRVGFTECRRQLAAAISNELRAYGVHDAFLSYRLGQLLWATHWLDAQRAVMADRMVVVVLDQEMIDQVHAGIAVDNALLTGQMIPHGARVPITTDVPGMARAGG